MPIVLVRVDDRFIHGQILEGWLPSTRAQEVLVANDDLANDSLQQMIMQASMPYAIRLVVDCVDQIAALLVASEDGDIRRMVIVDNPVDALRLKRAGVHFEHLNLGNLRSGQSTTSLSRSVLVGDECLEVLCDIVEEGVRVNLQSVPFEKPVDLADVFSCCPKL
ncbi:MAG TPA: PTS sugar transporter subunit IIB [Desulfomonilaceae bacterium]|nr:PTS sugar transporter subunit IIB [Desulfomonilaceae bacterium]